MSMSERDSYADEYCERAQWEKGYSDGYAKGFADAKKKYSDRPHGEWIWKKDEDALRTYDLLCSECGCKIFTCENYDNVEQAKKVVDDRIREGKTLYPFCPCCGSDNRKRGEAE